MVEHAAVNRGVVGSSPTRGAITLGEVFHEPSVKPARPLSEVFSSLVEQIEVFVCSSGADGATTLDSSRVITGLLSSSATCGLDSLRVRYASHVSDQKTVAKCS